MQVAYLSRLRRVIAFDPPGIGRAERTTDPAAFELDRVVDYGIGLLDHLGVARAAVAGVSMGGSYGLWLAARYPERVEKLVLMSSVPPEWAFGEDPTFWERRDSYLDWDKRNAHFWREHYREWLDFFFGKVVTEPHSTKLDRRLREVGARDHARGADRERDQPGAIPGAAARGGGRSRLLPGARDARPGGRDRGHRHQPQARRGAPGLGAAHLEGSGHVFQRA